MTLDLHWQLTPRSDDPAVRAPYWWAEHGDYYAEVQAFVDEDKPRAWSVTYPFGSCGGTTKGFKAAKDAARNAIEKDLAP